jgi:hypothetical protein
MILYVTFLIRYRAVWLVGWVARQLLNSSILPLVRELQTTVAARARARTVFTLELWLQILLKAWMSV